MLKFRGATIRMKKKKKNQWSPNWRLWGLPCPRTNRMFPPPLEVAPTADVEDVATVGAGSAADVSGAPSTTDVGAIVPQPGLVAPPAEDAPVSVASSASEATEAAPLEDLSEASLANEPEMPSEQVSEAMEVADAQLPEAASPAPSPTTIGVSMPCPYPVEHAAKASLSTGAPSAPLAVWPVIPEWNLPQKSTRKRTASNHPLTGERRASDLSSPPTTVPSPPILNR